VTAGLESECLTLAEYVAALVAELALAEPGAEARLRRVVGRRRARIQLDEEAVDAWFSGDGTLSVATSSAGAAVDGAGYTDRATVLDLLDGYLEVTTAISSGRLAVTGKAEDVVRMFQAIEILLDASARVPGLQRTALDFRDDPCREERFSPRRARTEAAEVELLLRIDTMPGEADSPP
jgi:hypothetical protein